MWPRKKYQAAVIGLESETVYPLDFVRFWTLWGAWDWCIRMNAAAASASDHPPLTRFAPKLIDRNRPSTGLVDTEPPGSSLPSLDE